MKQRGKFDEHHSKCNNLKTGTNIHHHVTNGKLELTFKKTKPRKVNE